MSITKDRLKEIEESMSSEEYTAFINSMEDYRKLTERMKLKMNQAEYIEWIAMQLNYIINDKSTELGNEIISKEVKAALISIRTRIQNRTASKIDMLFAESIINERDENESAESQREFIMDGGME